MTNPFQFPATPHARRHGPRGYADYSSYRPWLRDDFSFRCVFCLLRERWVTGAFHLDHFLPTSQHPNEANEYDNLLYSCAACNSAKRDLDIPDPTQVLVDADVRVQSDGTLVATSPAAIKLIRLLDLNCRTYRDYRVMWMDILTLAEREQPDLHQRLLSFPDDLPDLTTLRPPDGNSRHEGIRQSYFMQRERGELMEFY